MEEISTPQLYELFDSLTPYEVAVLAFTSPATPSDADLERELVTLTAKEAYLWAGAIAHLVIRYPRIERETVERMLARAIEAEMQRTTLFESPAAVSVARSRGYFSTGVIDEFLREADLAYERDVIERRTSDAVQSLLWRGHIEDPFSKRIRGVLLGVILLMPVSFTSTGPNDVRLNALTWEYVQHVEAGQPSREIRVKVKEISDVVIERLIPEAAHAVSTLEKSQSGQGMTDRDVQVRLAQLGYYSGEIDGRIGPKTIDALRRFQRDHFLEVTGYVDPDTARRLSEQ